MSAYAILAPPIRFLRRVPAALAPVCATQATQDRTVGHATAARLASIKMTEGLPGVSCAVRAHLLERQGHQIARSAQQTLIAGQIGKLAFATQGFQARMESSASPALGENIKRLRAPQHASFAGREPIRTMKDAILFVRCVVQGKDLTPRVQVLCMRASHAKPEHSQLRAPAFVLAAFQENMQQGQRIQIRKIASCAKHQNTRAS